MKLQDIEAYLKENAESTHIIYGIPVTIMEETKRALGGEIFDLPFQKSKYTYKLTSGKVELIMHSITKKEFQLSRY